MVEKNALLELTNPDYPGHQVALEHQQSIYRYIKKFCSTAEVSSLE
ncbi:MAG: hypothetical protein V7K33_27060 [Nostoc sp.]